MARAKDVWYEKEINILVSEITNLKTIEETRLLFDRIVTPREINDIAKRLEGIKMLENGSSYSVISSKLGLSPVTISKLANNIGYGFRRSNSPAKRTTSSNNKNYYQKKTLYYKGIPTIKVNG